MVGTLHTRECTAALLVVKAGCNSSPLGFHLNWHMHRATTEHVKKAQIILCCLHSPGTCILRFPLVQTRTLTRVEQLHSQQINSQCISVSYNAALTPHMFKIDKGETPAMKMPHMSYRIPCLGSKQDSTGVCFSSRPTSMQQHLGLPERKQGITRHLKHYFFFLLNKTCMNPSSE